MLKRLIIPFLLFPLVTFAQFTDDFEDADITDWTESTAGRWAASDVTPLSGSYSLHHIFDNTVGDHDQVSMALPVMDITTQTIAWRFLVRYAYNPYSSNNWSVYLMSDADAAQMHPAGTANGYVLGVNYIGTDDLIKIWKITSGVATEVASTTIDWNSDVGTTNAPAIEVIRNTSGNWTINYNLDGDFNSLTNIGTGTDASFTNTDYFGVYYEYTSGQDRQLWIDDIYVGPEIVDVIKPRVDSLYVLSSQQLKVEYTEKIDSAIAVTKSNYTLNGGIGNPDSVVVDALHMNTELFFNQKFTDNQQYDITIQNIEDKEGNVIKDTTLNFTYEYLKPLSVAVISDNEIEVQFSRKVDTSSAKDASNYSLNNGIGNPSIANIFVDDSAKVLLQFATDFTNETYYDLTIQDVADRNLDSLQTEIITFLYFIPEEYDVVINEIMADPNPEVNLPNYEYIEIFNTTGFEIDLTGWKFKIGSSERTFTDQVIESDEYITLCSATASEFLDDYGTVIDFSSFPTVTNSGTSIVIFDENDNIIDSISFTSDWYNNPEKEDGGWSIEKIDPLNNCSGITNWKASEDENGGTPGQENSVYANNIDTQSPNIENIQIISNTQLNIIFSEPVISTAENTSNYLIDNSIGSPISATLSNTKEVLLTFKESFVDGDSYTVTVENIEDYCGNVSNTLTWNFTYHEVQQFDIVINEVMADPEPSIGLPAYEYIEIYNTTNFDIDLSGWKLKIGTSERDFPDSIIISSGYTILCSNTASEFFEDFGVVSAFSSFPLLNNSGASIVLLDKNNFVIDSINFTSDWYNDPEKEDGGWSIEKIDPLNNCSGITNWKASEDENGGTPGQENSVYASNIDNSAPKIATVDIISDNQLKISFDEPVTESTILEKTNYQINHSVGNPLSVIASTDFREVELVFLNSFPQEIKLTLSVENLEDYCGNTSTTNTFDFIYYVVKPNDLVFNEIMANPDPAIALPEVEYIELYNTTDYDIRLKDWTLTVGSTLKYFADDTIHSGDYLILCDDDEESQLSNFGHTSIFSSLSLTDGGQTLVIRDNFNNIISHVSYSQDWYQDDYKADGGWSLEQIDPFNPCGEENNWIASESESGGTPGKQNSVFDNNPDVEAPVLLRIAVVDDQNIKLFFNESIDSLSAMQTDLYSVDNGVGNPISIDLDAPDYKSMILGFSNNFENGVIYNLEISEGITDCAGNEINEINTAKFSIPEVPEENDIVLNEILFNPLPGGFDFVEIYNRSGKTIDVKDLRIASLDIETGEYTGVEQIISEGYLIFPGDYVVLTENPEMVKKQYYTSNPDGFIETDLPSYNDDNGIVLLMDKSINILDKLEYDEDMQFSLLATNEGVSLERINYNRPAEDKTNWHSASELVGFATPAYENSQYIESEDIEDEVTIEPEVFSPDNDGFEDVANINFTLDEPGYIANIKIFDSRGRLIRYLANNQLLGIEGVITWDGLDDKSQKAPVGIYVVFIEVFDLEGNVKQYKKSIVVAAKY